MWYKKPLYLEQAGTRFLYIQDTSDHIFIFQKATILMYIQPDLCLTHTKHLTYQYTPQSDGLVSMSG